MTVLFWSICLTCFKEDSGQIDFFLRNALQTFGKRAFCPMMFLLPLKNINFCSWWFVVDLSLACLRWTRQSFKNRPILLDLSSWKIESIFRIGLPNLKRNRFFLGGILDTDVSQQGPKETSKERFLGKIDLQAFPQFLGNKCPMNLSASRILMVLNLFQGTESR